MSNPTSDKNPYITEGILIATIPAIAYLFAFIFEAGYLKIFKIPINLIRIDLITVFITGGSLVFVSFFLLVIADFLSMVFSASENPIRRLFVRLFPIFLYSIAISFYAIGTNLQPMLIGLGIMWVFRLFLDFLFPLITQRKKKTYREKLEAQQAHDAQTTSFLTRVSQRLGGTANVIIFLIMALIVTYYAGQSSAMRQHEFLIASTFPDFVVIRTYGDTMICAQFDKNEQIVHPVFRFLKIAEDSDIIFTLEKIGPIKQITNTPERLTKTPTIGVSQITTTP
jgi:hypothetical protein